MNVTILELGRDQDESPPGIGNREPLKGLPPMPGRKNRVKRRLARLPYTITLAILLIVGTPLAAWRVSSERTPVYAARAEVLANDTTDAPNAAQFEAAVATQRVVMKSRALVGPVAVAHGLDVADLEENLTVNAPTGSTVLQVTFEHEDSELAMEVVDALVAAYLALVPVSTDDAATQLLLDEISRLETERAQVEEELVSIEARNAQARATGASVENPTRERQLSDESADYVRRIGNIEERLSQMAIEGLEAETDAVVSSPFVLPDPVSPDPVQATVLGSLVGLALGGTLVLIWAQGLAARRRANAASTERRANAASPQHRV